MKYKYAKRDGSFLSEVDSDKLSKSITKLLKMNYICKNNPKGGFNEDYFTLSLFSDEVQYHLSSLGMDVIFDNIEEVVALRSGDVNWGENLNKRETIFLMTLRIMQIESRSKVAVGYDYWFTIEDIEENLRTVGFFEDSPMRLSELKEILSLLKRRGIVYFENRDSEQIYILPSIVHCINQEKVELYKNYEKLGGF